MHDRSALSQLVLSRKWQSQTRRTEQLVNLFSNRIDAYQHVLPIEISRTLQECLPEICEMPL